MNKQTHDQIIKKVIQKIIDAGIPNDSIVREYGNRNGCVDIAIMAQQYLTPVAVFEIKIDRNKRLFESGIRTLKRITSTLKISVKCYLVCAKDDDVEIFDVGNIVYGQDEFNNDSINNYIVEQFPDFASLQNDLQGKNDAMIEAKKQEYEILLKRLCFWGLPLYLIIVIALDKLEWMKLTDKHLIVHGAVVVITILPFVSELSMAGLHLKLKSSESENKK